MSEPQGGAGTRGPHGLAARLPGNRRLALVVAVVIALAALVAGVLAGGGGEGSAAAPREATLQLVPAGALVALHLSTDSGRSAVRDAGALAGRLPSWPALRKSLLARLDGPGCGIDVDEDPGREVTFALLPGKGGTASPLLLTDAPADGLPEQGGQPCGALVVRRIGDVVAIGEPDSLAAAAGVAAGSRRALVASPVFRAAARDLPAGRVISAWASPAGVRQVLPAAGNLLATLSRIVDMPGLRGAVASLVPEQDRARIVIHRIASKGVEAPAFRPTLQDHAPADTISYSASGDLAGGLQSLLLLRGAAAAQTLDGLLKAGGDALTRLSKLVRESAFVVGPGPDGPQITLLARTREPRAARAAMRDLEGALGRLIEAPGAAFADADLAGPARRLDAAGATLAYGFDGPVLALSTSAAGVAAARASGARLGSQPAARAVTGKLRAGVTSLVFLDPNQLLRLGVDTGTELDDALQDVRGDLASVRAIGIKASGTGRSSTVELSLLIP